MSILIKGMKMPKNCEECPCEHYECLLLDKEAEDIMQYFTGDKRHPDCPLVELPPHGRLIDADALDDAFTDLRWENGDYKSGALLHWGDRPNWCLTGSEIESLINAAPTIIEAEGGRVMSDRFGYGEIGLGIESGENDKQTTNADRIRSMTDEELAEFMRPWDSGCPRWKENPLPCSDWNNCGECWLKWLKEKVSE